MPPVERPVAGPVGAPREPREKSIPEQQEIARQRLAYCPIGIFGFEIMALMAGVLVPLFLCGVAPLDEIKELSFIVFGPTVGVVGSVMGFYFGSPKSPGRR